MCREIASSPVQRLSDNVLGWRGDMLAFNIQWESVEISPLQDLPLAASTTALLPFSVAVLVLTQTILSAVEIACTLLFALTFFAAYAAGGAVATFPFIPELASIASSYRHTEVITYVNTCCVHTNLV